MNYVEIKCKYCHGTIEMREKDVEIEYISLSPSHLQPTGKVRTLDGKCPLCRRDTDFLEATHPLRMDTDKS